VSKEISPTKIEEVARKVESAEDLLKLAQAKRILDTLERSKTKSFPWEASIKYISVVIGALVGVTILTVTEVTSYFWDSYKFASVAREEAQLELATQTTKLQKTQVELSSITEALRVKEEEIQLIELGRGKAEKDFEKALSSLQATKTAAKDQKLELNKVTADLEATSKELVETERKLDQTIDELRQMQGDIKFAQVSSIRMYSCNVDFVEDAFNQLSDYHGYKRLEQIMQPNNGPELYLSLQFIGDQSLRYSSNIRYRGGPRKRGPARTEFGHWKYSDEVVTLSLTMSAEDRARKTFSTLEFRTKDLVKFVTEKRMTVCSTNRGCFHRWSTCTVEE